MSGYAYTFVTVIIVNHVMRQHDFYNCENKRRRSDKQTYSAVDQRLHTKYNPSTSYI